MINWAALGEARGDGSDTTSVLLHLARERRDAPFTLQGVVRPLDFEPKNKPFLLADPSGLPAGASTYLQAWPAMWRTAEDMLLALYPCKDPRYPVGWRGAGGCYGCKSANLVDFGHVYASTVSTSAFVEGIVSSLANWKLYAAGIAHDEWSRDLLDFAPDPTWPSMLRPGEPAKAGAIVQVAYCMAHVLVYYRQLLNLQPVPQYTEFMIQQSWTRLERGRNSLRAMIGNARNGFDQYLERFLMWSDRLLSTPPEGT